MLAPIHSTSVSFRLLNNHILVPVSVEGVEMEFMFDTSAKNTVLLERALKQLPTKNVSETNIKIAKAELTIPLDNSLNTTINAQNNNSYFDGILGQDFFHNKIVEINYDSKTLSLFSRRAFKDNFIRRTTGWGAMPLTINDGTMYVNMPLTLDKHSRYFDFAIDTGLNLDLVLHSSILNDQLTPEYSYTTPHFDSEGKQEFTVYPLDRTYLDDHPIVWPLVHSYKEKDTTSTKQKGVVGNAILSRFNLIIDAADETLYYQENQRHSVKNFPDRSGITVTPHPNGARITSADTPGSKLLKQNDIIQSYEGITITESTFDGFRLMLSSEAEQLWVCWLRDEEKQCGNLEMGYRM
ncbi:pepsin/retropepsin-like aspartic protease family protein [Planctobacterium marinum]|nr:hypothetical protein [Planctobacterium marinum]